MKDFQGERNCLKECLSLTHLEVDQNTYLFFFSSGVMIDQVL